MKIVSIEVATRCEPHPLLDHTNTFLRNSHAGGNIQSLSPIKVPMIRLFCSLPARSETEQPLKCCVHFHQIYPYLLIRLPKEPSSSAPTSNYTDQFISQLWHSINRALSLSYSANSAGTIAEQISNEPQQQQQQHVMAIVLVSALDMYGVHLGPQPFLKIYLLQPSAVQRLADLFWQGAVMGQQFQPYESHLPFPLQMMVDYNLRGMDDLSLQYARFRHSLTPAQSERVSASVQRWNNGKSCNNNYDGDNDYGDYDDGDVEDIEVGKETNCLLECDAWPWDIRNRTMVRQRLDEFCRPVFRRQEKLVPSLNCLWEVFL
jgi:DNA polymerase zeta